ncbi:MBL fold metallo-hydrolase [Pseudonocardia sp. WMMC193]|uniref:MBL fold metallo-hydrolase n=1 Tax=Pseudonocardia sp. WMMC193 TaxID=2911965 RepID=UPI001F172C55|nr:MBL fold metallo-hydrolase [Pseudonocardia sp. WMMC193]MCF7551364.1 MBL fold metallo-hydrolase [Pseudonocardia sp. WMMC193]
MIDVVDDQLLSSLEEADPAVPWHTPGVYAVTEGVFRIPLPLPDEGLHSVNVYAVEGPDGLTLVDSGEASAASRADLVRALAALGHGVQDVRRILVTHVHRDHYTLAVALRRETGLELHLGRGEQASLRLVADPARGMLRTQLDMLVECGAGALAAELAPAEDPLPASIWEDPDHWVDEGPVRAGARVLDALPTPGHTAGHLVFRDAAGSMLFAGDHVLPHITPSIGFEPAPPTLPLGEYIRSLQLVRALPDTRLLPAHGHVTRSVHDRVDALLAHHDDRLESTLLAVLPGEGATAHEVAGRLVWTRRARPLSGLSPVNRMLAVLETKAHLDLLVVRSLLRSELVDGVRRYARP